MLSGRRLDLLDPAPDDIEIVDIAHGLARVARWNGQTTGAHAFSVAQHCVLVEEIASALSPRDAWSAAHRLAALLHDAPEYVVGDLISPFKAAIGLDYRAFEARLLGAIYRRFGISDEVARSAQPTIKVADRTAAYYEATRLAGFAEDEAQTYFGAPLGLPEALADRLSAVIALPTNDAQCAFLSMFAECSRPAV
jgi:hypothetical protein